MVQAREVMRACSVWELSPCHELIYELIYELSPCHELIYDASFPHKTDYSDDDDDADDEDDDDDVLTYTRVQI